MNSTRFHTRSCIPVVIFNYLFGKLLKVSDRLVPKAVGLASFQRIRPLSVVQMKNPCAFSFAGEKGER